MKRFLVVLLALVLSPLPATADPQGCSKAKHRFDVAWAASLKKLEQERKAVAKRFVEQATRYGDPVLLVIAQLNYAGLQITTAQNDTKGQGICVETLAPDDSVLCLHASTSDPLLSEYVEKEHPGLLGKGHHTILWEILLLNRFLREAAQTIDVGEPLPDDLNVPFIRPTLEKAYKAAKATQEACPPDDTVLLFVEQEETPQ